MPQKNKSEDEQIIQLSLKEQRVVISKDNDFFDRYFLKLEPYKLLFIATGNISNNELLQIFE